MEDIDELKRQLKTHGFGVILEVTCAIMSEKIRQKKKYQLIDGKRYIKRLVDSNPEIYTGLMFDYYTDPSQIADLQGNEVDFLLQIPAYEIDRFRQAFEQARNSLGSKVQQSVTTVLNCIEKGEDLEGLLSSQLASEWCNFLQRFPEITGPKPTVNDCYNLGIHKTRGGTILEKYAGLLCLEELPGVFLHGSLVYWREIDLILVGPKEKIIQGLNNPRLFRRYHEKDVI